MTTPVDCLAVWSGLPVHVFPPGAHVFPADRDALRELVAALRADLAAPHDLPVAVVREAQGRDAGDVTAPFPVAHLREFLARRRPAFDRGAQARIVATSRAHGERRLAQLRALGAPAVIVAHEEAELARVSAPGWTPTIDVELLAVDIVATAAALDLDARTDDQLVVDADLTDLVLLCAQCCVAPDAEAVEDDASLPWQPLVEEHEDPPPPGVVRVRGEVRLSSCERLEHAEVGATALLAVTMADDSE